MSRVAMALQVAGCSYMYHELLTCFIEIVGPCLRSPRALTPTVMSLDPCTLHLDCGVLNVRPLAEISET